MSFILSKSLHPDKNYWYSNIQELWNELVSLQTLIKQLPELIRQTLHHPIIEETMEEDSSPSNKWESI